MYILLCFDYLSLYLFNDYSMIIHLTEQTDVCTLSDSDSDSRCSTEGTNEQDPDFTLEDFMCDSTKQGLFYDEEEDINDESVSRLVNERGKN